MSAPNVVRCRNEKCELHNRPHFASKNGKCRRCSTSYVKSEPEKPAVAPTVTKELSVRESTVVRLLKEGNNIHQIAELLITTPDTVKHLIQAVRRKVGMPTGGRIGIKIANLTGQPEGEFNSSSRFSEKELTILRLVAKGLTNREISVILQFSGKAAVQSIKNYCVRIFQKIGCHNRGEAAAWYWQHCESSPIRPLPEPAGEVLKGAVNHV